MAIGLAVGLLLALGGLVVVAVTAGDDGSSDDAASSAGRTGSAADLLDAEAAAEKAARAAAVRLTTYDYRSVATDFDWAVLAGTPSFRDKYAEVSAPIMKVVVELKVHAVGTVNQAAATATDPDHVTVLLFVDQVLTSEEDAEPKISTPRITMAMVRQDGRWLVDDVAIPDLVER